MDFVVILGAAVAGSLIGILFGYKWGSRYTLQLLMATVVTAFGTKADLTLDLDELTERVSKILASKEGRAAVAKVAYLARKREDS